MFRGGAVEKDAVELEFQHLRDEDREHRFGVGLDDVVDGEEIRSAGGHGMTGRVGLGMRGRFLDRLEMTRRRLGMTGRGLWVGGEGEEGFADGGLGGGRGEVVVDEFDARVAAVEKAVDALF